MNSWFEKKSENWENIGRLKEYPFFYKWKYFFFVIKELILSKSSSIVGDIGWKCVKKCYFTYVYFDKWRADYEIQMK